MHNSLNTTSTNKQAICYWAWDSQEEWKLPQMEYTHCNSSSYANTIPAALCMSNGLTLVFYNYNPVYYLPNNICNQ